jgi:hypothetical protein
MHYRFILQFSNISVLVAWPNRLGSRASDILESITNDVEIYALLEILWLLLPFVISLAWFGIPIPDLA